MHVDFKRMKNKINYSGLISRYFNVIPEEYVLALKSIQDDQTLKLLEEVIEQDCFMIKNLNAVLDDFVKRTSVNS